MRHPIATILSILAILTISGCSLEKQKFKDEPDVKVITGAMSHGSGFYIGKNIIITAAHVTAGKKDPITVRTLTGRIYKAEVLWENTKYDIAAIRIEKPSIKIAMLDCKDPVLGDWVKAKGHPYEMEYIETNGRIAGPTRSFGPWGEVWVGDFVLGPGMSGGGIYHNGYVVGVSVGIRNAQGAFGQSLGPSGFGLAVPSSAVCKLMGR